MRTIWKKALQPRDDIELLLPVNATVFHVGLDADGQMSMWFFVPDTEAPKSERVFHVYGTGNPIMQAEHRIAYRGSVTLPPFVWHVFEEVRAT